MAVEPPRDGIYPRAQFGTGERADDVVIGAGIQRFHRRLGIALVAQHKDRVAAAGLAQAEDMLDGPRLLRQQHRPVRVAVAAQQPEFALEEIVTHGHGLPLRRIQFGEQAAEGV